MLQALMDGRALTATELAYAARITPQTASSHLAQLASASIVSVAKQGRHRYHRLATPHVAQLLESMMLVASNASARVTRSDPSDFRMRLARTCYDHVAGWLGVAIADTLVTRRWVEILDDAALVTSEGLDSLGKLGIVVETSDKRGRPLCRPCLDWSERRPHIAGRLGMTLCTHGLEKGWIRRRAEDRTPRYHP